MCEFGSNKNTCTSGNILQEIVGIGSISLNTNMDIDSSRNGCIYVFFKHGNRKFIKHIIMVPSGPMIDSVLKFKGGWTFLPIKQSLCIHFVSIYTFNTPLGRQSSTHYMG